MSWKKFGGIKQLDTFNNLNTNSITTDDFVMREAYKGTFTISGELYVMEDCSLNGNVFVEKNVSVGKSVHVHDRVIIGDNNVRFLKNTERGLGLDVISPQATFDISGSNDHILHVFSSQESVKSTLVQNKSHHKTVLHIDNSSASIVFHVRDNSASLVYDVCKNHFILDKVLSLKQSLFTQGNVVIHDDLLVHDDTTMEGDLHVLGQLLLDGALTLNNDLSMNGNLFVNRDTTLQGKLNVGNVIIRDLGGLFWRDMDANKLILRKQVESDVSSTDFEKLQILQQNSIALTDNVLIKGNLYLEGQTNITVKGVQNGILKDLSGTNMQHLNVNYLSTTISNEALKGAGFYIYNRYSDPITIEENRDGFMKVSDVCSNKLSFRSVGSERDVIALNFAKTNNTGVETGLMVMQSITELKNNMNDNFDIVSSHHVPTVYVNSSLESVHNLNVESIQTLDITTSDLQADTIVVEYGEVMDISAETMNISAIHTNTIIGQESNFVNTFSTGKATFQYTDICGNLSVLKTSTFYGNVYLKNQVIGNTLLVQNNATIQKDMHIMGNIHGSQDISINGSITSTRSGTQDLLVKQYITIGSGNIDHTQAVSITGDLSMNGTASIDSIVVRKTLKTSDISCSGNIFIKNNGFLDLNDGSLKCFYNGNIYSLSAEILSYLQNINSDVKTSLDNLNNINDVGSLKDNTFTGNNTFLGNTVLKSTSISSVSVSGDMIVSGNALMKNTSISGDLIVRNDAYVSGDLLVKGNISGTNKFIGVTIFENKAEFTDITVSGDSILNKTLINNNLVVDGKFLNKQISDSINDTVTYFQEFEKGTIYVKNNIKCIGYPLRKYVYASDGIADEDSIPQLPSSSNFFSRLRINPTNTDITLNTGTGNGEFTGNIITISPIITETMEGGVIECQKLISSEITSNKINLNGNLTINSLNYTPARLIKTLNITNDDDEQLNLNNVVLTELKVNGKGEMESLRVNGDLGLVVNKKIEANGLTIIGSATIPYLTSNTINVQYLNVASSNTDVNGNVVSSQTLESNAPYAIYRSGGTNEGFGSGGVMIRQNNNDLFETKGFVYMYDTSIVDKFFIGTVVETTTDNKQVVTMKKKGDLYVNIYESDYVNTGNLIVSGSIRVANITGSKDISMSGNIFGSNLVLTRDMRCVNITGSRDISMVGNVFARSMFLRQDISLAGSIYSNSATLLNKLNCNAITGTTDISMGGNIYGTDINLLGVVYSDSVITNNITGLRDISMGGDIYASSLYLLNDVSMVGSLYGNTIVLSNNLRCANITGDRDISMGGNIFARSLFLSRDISMAGGLYSSFVNTTNITGSRDISMGGNIFARSLFLSRDISMAGGVYNTFVNTTNITGDRDISMGGNMFASSLFLSRDISMLGGEYSSFVNTTNITGSRDISMGGNMFASSLFLSKDISMLGGMYSSFVNTVNITGARDISMGGNIFARSLFLSRDISMGGNMFASSLFLSRDISMGGNMFASSLFLSRDISMGGNMFASSLFLSKDISMAGGVYNTFVNTTNITGARDISMGGNMFASSLFLSKDVSMAGGVYNTFVNTTNITGARDISMGGNMFASSLFLSKDISMGGNVFGKSLNFKSSGTTRMEGNDKFFINVPELSVSGFLTASSGANLYGNIGIRDISNNTTTITQNNTNITFYNDTSSGSFQFKTKTVSGNVATLLDITSSNTSITASNTINAYANNSFQIVSVHSTDSSRNIPTLKILDNCGNTTQIGFYPRASTLINPFVTDYENVIAGEGGGNLTLTTRDSSLCGVRIYNNHVILAAGGTILNNDISNTNVSIHANGNLMVLSARAKNGMTITSTGLTSVPTFEAKDATTGKKVGVYNNLMGESYIPSVQSGDQGIIAGGNTGDVSGLYIGLWSSVNNGLRTSKDETRIGWGGAGSTPNYFIKCSTAGNEISGNTKITGPQLEITNDLSQTALQRFTCKTTSGNASTILYQNTQDFAIQSQKVGGTMYFQLKKGSDYVNTLILESNIYGSVATMQDISGPFTYWTALNTNKNVFTLKHGSANSELVFQSCDQLGNPYTNISAKYNEINLNSNNNLNITAPNVYGSSSGTFNYTATGGFNLTGAVKIYETTGTTMTATAGTLVLEHGNSGGQSSILFVSAVNRTSDYGYIRYIDNVDSTVGGEKSRLEIGTENDAGPDYWTVTDAVVIQKSGGYVGIGTSNPTSTLDVNGTITTTDISVNNSITVNSISIGRGGGNNQYSTAVGGSALVSNTGTSNSAFGYYALNANTSGYYNCAFGTGTLGKNTTGVSNSAFGFNALFENTSGTVNTAIGNNALKSNTTAFYNTAVGNQALQYNTTGTQNTAVGHNNLFSNTTGNYNTSIGLQGLFYNITSSSNVAIGNNTLYFLEYKGAVNGVIYNTAATGGSMNVAVGNNALFWMVNGTGNTAIGDGAGTWCTHEFFNNCTFLGRNTGIAATMTNKSTSNVQYYQYSTAIGYGAVFDGNNQIVLGTSTETVKIPGTLQIVSNYAAPSANANFYISSNNSTNQLLMFVHVGQGNYNPMNSSGATAIIAAGAVDAKTLFLGVHSNTSSGLRLQYNNVLLGAGGGAGNPSLYFNCNATDNKNYINGYTQLNSSLELLGGELTIKNPNATYSAKSASLLNFTGQTFLILKNGSNLNIRCDSSTSGSNYTDSAYPIIIENHATDWQQIKAYYNHVEKIRFRDVADTAAAAAGPTKIELYAGYGFGIEPNTLKYLSSKYHTFYTGSYSTGNGVLRGSITDSGLYIYNSSNNNTQIAQEEFQGTSYSVYRNNANGGIISFQTKKSTETSTVARLNIGTDNINIIGTYLHFYDVNAPFTNFTKINHEGEYFVIRNYVNSGQIAFQTKTATGTFPDNRFVIRSDESSMYTNFTVTGGINASSYTTAGDINLTGTLGGINFRGASKIYDNAHLHINTDDNMYFDIGTTNKLLLTSTAATFNVNIDATGYTIACTRNKCTDIFCQGVAGYLLNGTTEQKTAVENTHYNLQGLYCSWNHDNGGGRGAFVCNKGGGAGGFDFMLNTSDISGSRFSRIVQIDSAGGITATSYNATSDYRIKEDVKPLDDTFTVDNLKPVTYHNTKLNKQDVGFIAHEVQEEYPFMVNGDKDGKDMQTLNYTSIIGILVKEIQDLKREMKGMRETIASLQSDHGA
jgi:hypothetical protein